jgi:hypothetical protein
VPDAPAPADGFGHEGPVAGEQVAPLVVRGCRGRERHVGQGVQVRDRTIRHASLPVDEPPISVVAMMRTTAEIAIWAPEALPHCVLIEVCAHPPERSRVAGIPRGAIPVITVPSLAVTTALLRAGIGILLVILTLRTALVSWRNSRGSAVGERIGLRRGNGGHGGEGHKEPSGGGAPRGVTGGRARASLVGGSGVTGRRTR